MNTIDEADLERWSTRRTARELDLSEVSVRNLDPVLRPLRDARGQRSYIPRLVLAYRDERSQRKKKPAP